jgi:putative CocE/NonD family hydrolase
MSKKLLVFIFLFKNIVSFSQNLNSDSLYIVTHYTKIEKQIPMRDGVKLFTAIHLPNDNSVKHPILFVRTPYSCAPYGENKFSDRWWTRGDSAYFYHNYIVVVQDVRGKFMSEGTFEDIRPYIANKKSKKETDESTDAYDAIDWLVKNVKNNNGNVGVSGISYPGFYATMAALSNHPDLKAVSPQAPVTDWFMGDDFHHNGVCFLMDCFSFYRGFGLPRVSTTIEWPRIPEINASDNYSYFLQQGTFSEIKKKHFGDTIKFWNDVAQHPDYDAWWQDRNARVACNNIKPAILITGGLFDAEDCFGAWNLFKAIKKQSPQTNCKIVNGPWIHGGWSRTKGDRLGNVWFGSKTSEDYWKSFELPFFDFYLKGEGSIDAIAITNVFITGENAWSKFEQWPPSAAENKMFYFNSDENLSIEKPTQKKSFDSYISDPMKPVPYTDDVHFKRTREYMTDDQRFASRRQDVLTYRSEILTEDVTVTGPVIADLWVSITTTDADFVVKLIDVFPDDFKYPATTGINYPMGGYEMLVRGEIMRGRYRNSFAIPEAFGPNKIAQVKYELPDVAHTFKKGHRIMVQVQSTWFPLADRNPQQFLNTYTNDSRTLIKSAITIYHDEQHSSGVSLPVLKR